MTIDDHVLFNIIMRTLYHIFYLLSVTFVIFAIEKKSLEEIFKHPKLPKYFSNLNVTFGKTYQDRTYSNCMQKNKLVLE